MKIIEKNFGHLVEFNSNDDIKKKVRLEDITDLVEDNGRYYIRIIRTIKKEKTHYISKKDYSNIKEFIEKHSEQEKEDLKCQKLLKEKEENYKKIDNGINDLGL